MPLSDVDQSVIATSHTWPAACPHHLESSFLSVVVRETHYHFAVHRDKSRSYQPDTFWKVPITSITDDHDESNEDCESKIIQYVPDFALPLFFPKSEAKKLPSVAESIEYMVTAKTSPIVSLYIVPGTNSKANMKLQKLFERYPVRITLLKSFDFYPTTSLPFQGLCRHNLAAVRGVDAFPALIIESDDLLTFTIVDENGQIVGGNTSLGLYSQLSLALQNFNEIDSSVSPDAQAKQLVDNFLDREQPLSWTNPYDAILNGVLQPLLLSMVSISNVFLEKYGKKDLSECSIFIHGKNGELLHSLLEKKNLSKLSKDLESTTFPAVQLDIHLVHRGIGAMLLQYDTTVLSGSDREKCLHFIGQRIARNFGQNMADPDIYRGVVSCYMQVKDGNPWDGNFFEVIYDDGDREELDVFELYESLRLYSVVGEKLRFATTGDAALSKKESSRAAARSLATWSDKIRQVLELQQMQQNPHEQRTGKAEIDGGHISKSNGKRARAGSFSKISSIASAGKLGQRKKKDREAMVMKTKPVLNKLRKERRLPEDQSPSDFINRRIAKHFGEGLFYGTIVSYTTDKRTLYWQIEYEDGDSEEMDYKEVMEQIDLFDSLKSEHSKCEAISISDGEPGDSNTQRNPSSTVIHGNGGNSDPGQSTTRDLLGLQAVGEPTEVSDQDDNPIESVLCSNRIFIC